ncbi:MAG TPA: dihydroorotate dehydrogenase electron transfer subunit [Acidobacteriota bacterium]|nr:dihydroorotate dehydrogenase electron transfer subunit [Acidobacteriota bacterium]
MERGHPILCIPRGQDRIRKESALPCAILALVQLETGRIVASKTPGDGYVVLTVQAPGIAAAVKPGQFVMAGCTRDSETPFPLLKRALAVFTLPDRETTREQFTLLIRVVGEGTRRLASLDPGEAIDLIGPLGNGFDLAAASGQSNLLVAGGTGLASLYLLAEELARRGDTVLMAAGGRSAGDLVALAPFEELGIPLEITTEDGSRGTKGLVTAAVETILSRRAPRPYRLYACGPTAMMEAVGRLAAARGLPCSISVEVKMGCGFGVCLGCSVKTRGGYRLACTDGPVFDAAEFVWESEQWEGSACQAR